MHPESLWIFSPVAVAEIWGMKSCKKSPAVPQKKFTKENEVVHTHYNIWYLKTQISPCFVATHLLPWGLPSFPIQAPIWSGFHQRCQLVMSSTKWKDDSVQGPSKECPKWMVRGAIHCDPWRPFRPKNSMYQYFLIHLWLSLYTLMLFQAFNSQLWAVKASGFFMGVHWIWSTQKIAPIGCFRYMQTWSAFGPSNVARNYQPSAMKFR